jgi:hypothetical protein
VEIRLLLESTISKASGVPMERDNREPTRAVMLRVVKPKELLSKITEKRMDNKKSLAFN